MTTHTYAIGDRVRTLIDLTSAEWDPDTPDMPAGTLGTITGLPHPNFPTTSGYGVVLDPDPNKLAASMQADEFEPAP